MLVTNRLKGSTAELQLCHSVKEIASRSAHNRSTRICESTGECLKCISTSQFQIVVTGKLQSCIRWSKQRPSSQTEPA